GSLHWQRNRRWRAQEDENEPAACHARRGATDVPPSDGRSDGRALGLAAVEIGGREQQAPHDELQERPEPVEDARASVDRHADHPAAEESQPEEGDEDELATVGAGRGREPEREGPEHHEGTSVDGPRLDGALMGRGSVLREAHPLHDGQRHGEPGHAEDEGEQADGGDDDPRIHATSRAAALPLSVWDVAASTRTVTSSPGTAGPGNTAVISCGVCPFIPPSRPRAVPSTRPCTSAPTQLRWRSAAIDSCRAIRCSRRRCFSLSGTSSSHFAARVPSRAE